MNYDVSAVIPVYNNSEYISAAVKSVLGQTRPPSEVIVVDDGSTDDTRQELAKFGKNIKYVYQENRGEPAARNRGIREAKCEWIAFLDGDDLWRENKLELQMAYAARHPELALIYSDMCTFDKNGIIDASVKERFRMEFRRGGIFPALFQRSLFGSGSVVFRKKCVEVVGYFDENLLVGSDYEMWLRIARRFECGAVDCPLLMYRFHSSMSTQGLGVKMCNGKPWESVVLETTLRLHPKVLDELGRTGVNRRLSKPYAGAAMSRFRRGNYNEARALITRAIGYWPSKVSYWLLYIGSCLHPGQIAAAQKVFRKLNGHRRVHNDGVSASNTN